MHEAGADGGQNVHVDRGISSLGHAPKTQAVTLWQEPLEVTMDMLTCASEREE